MPKDKFAKGSGRCPARLSSQPKPAAKLAAKASSHPHNQSPKNAPLPTKVLFFKLAASGGSASPKTTFRKGNAQSVSVRSRATLRYYFLPL